MQLRELVRQNHALLQPMIQQLAASNPQLAQSLASNPEELLNILAGAGEDGEEGEGLPGVQVVNITAEEQAAIERVSCGKRWTKEVADGNPAPSARLFSRCGDPGVFCVRQERGASSELFV